MVAKEATPKLSRSIVLEDVKEAMSTELVHQTILLERSIVQLKVQGDTSGCSLDFIEIKLCFCIRSLYKNSTFVLLLTKPREQPACITKFCVAHLIPS